MPVLYGLGFIVSGLAALFVAALACRRLPADVRKHTDSKFMAIVLGGIFGALRGAIVSVAVQTPWYWFYMSRRPPEPLAEAGFTMLVAVIGAGVGLVVGAGAWRRK